MEVRCDNLAAMCFSVLETRPWMAILVGRGRRLGWIGFGGE